MNNSGRSGRGGYPSASGPVAVDRSFDADDLHGLREALAMNARRLGVAPHHIERLLIVATELASNAIRHGGGSGRLRLWCQGGALYCQVSDAGPGIADPAVGMARPAPDGLEGGRGMFICRSLASWLTIDSGPDGRGAVVTAAITV